MRRKSSQCAGSPGPAYRSRRAERPYVPLTGGCVRSDLPADVRGLDRRPKVAAARCRFARPPGSHDAVRGCRRGVVGAVGCLSCRRHNGQRPGDAEGVRLQPEGDLGRVLRLRQRCPIRGSGADQWVLAGRLGFDDPRERLPRPHGVCPRHAGQSLGAGDRLASEREQHGCAASPPPVAPDRNSTSEPAPIAGQGYGVAFQDCFETFDRIVWTDHQWYEPNPPSGTISPKHPEHRLATLGWVSRHLGLDRATRHDPQQVLSVRLFRGADGVEQRRPGHIPRLLALVDHVRDESAVAEPRVQRARVSLQSSTSSSSTATTPMSLRARSTATRAAVITSPTSRARTTGSLMPRGPISPPATTSTRLSGRRPRCDGTSTASSR